MIPPEQPLEIVQSASEPTQNEAFWDYSDLGLFITLGIASLFGSLVLVRFIPGLYALPDAYKLLLGQLIWYLLVFCCLAVILRARYDAPFWKALGWNPTHVGNAFSSLAAGPVIAIGLGLIGAAMHTPPMPLAFERLLNTTVLIVLFGALVVIVGPLCEELAFRGFMMPLLIRSLGPVAGIVITGILFGLLHGFEYPDWRPVALIATAGVFFGWRGYKTGSTVNSALMHAGFNLTQFVVLMAAKHANLLR
jgi:membrane protease YdiL (CAAX protease family)